MAANTPSNQNTPKRLPRGRAAKTPSAELERANRRVLVAEKTLEDWSVRRIADWLKAEHALFVSTTTIHEDRKWLLANATAEADTIRQLKVLQMLEISRGMLPVIHGTGKVLVRDPDTFEQDEHGEIVDGLRALVPTTGQRIEVLKTWLALHKELRAWVGVDRIEPAAKPDPADMGLSDVDRELAELAAYLEAQPERRK